MYKNILVLLSLDHGIAERAIKAARNMKSDGGEITALHVYEPMHGSVGAYVSQEAVNEAIKGAEALLAERTKGMDDVKTLMLKGHIGRVITDYATKNNIDCIVVGSHKPGMMDHFLGSTASRIARYAPCSVHVLR